MQAIKSFQSCSIVTLLISHYPQLQAPSVYPSCLQSPVTDPNPKARSTSLPAPRRSNQTTPASATTAATASHPLTKHNLYLFTFGMPPPRTPRGKGAQPSTPTNTPSKTEKSTTSGTTDKLPLHLIFYTNRMPVKDLDAQKRHPQVLEWAQSVRGGDRGSVMKPKSEKKLNARREQYRNSNEDTFIRNFMAALKKDNRRVWNAQKQKWKRVEWDQDGLKEAWNQSFRKNSIPQIDSSDKIAREILDRNPRIKNPKPDIVWALSPRVFDEEQMKINKMYYAQTGICPADIWHPFCILEAKMKGTIEDAIYQCARGGASLVSATRLLNHAAGLRDLIIPGADLTTPVFSLAVVPTVVSMLVHWAEVDKNGKTWYHTSHVFTYALENPGAGIMLRHDLDNILDWGTLTRKAMVIKLLAAIADAHRTNRLRELPTPDPTTIADDFDEDEQDTEDEEQRSTEELLEEALEQNLLGPETPTHRSKRRKLDKVGDKQIA